MKLWHFASHDQHRQHHYVHFFPKVSQHRKPNFLCARPTAGARLALSDELHVRIQSTVILLHLLILPSSRMIAWKNRALIITLFAALDGDGDGRQTGAARASAINSDG